MSKLTRREFELAAALTLVAGRANAKQLPPGKNVPWLEEIQTIPKNLPEDAPTLKRLLIGDGGSRITTVEQWQARREKIQREWLEFLGSLGLPENATPSFEVLHEDRESGVLRQLIRYENEPGIKTEAYLLRPLKDGPQKHPAVAVFHSTVNHSIRQPAGLGTDPEKAFGLKLAQRGYVTICPRNFLWPDNERIMANEEAHRFQSRHPNAKGMAKMLYDSRIAVNLLCGMESVDVERIGAVGHSLGAKETLYLPAFDERVKVAVSSEGGIGIEFSNWDAPWYLGPSVKDAAFRREHHELLGLVAPRPFLLIGGDSADGERGWPFIQAGLEVYRLYGEPARLGMFNHRAGHSVPPNAEKRIYEWFETYL